MKKNKIKLPALLALLTVVIMTSASAPVKKGLISVGSASQPITIFVSGPFDPNTSTSTGIVETTGAINATGTYVMQVEFLGNALHCDLVLTLPAGTITIRMLCNMVTFNGQWQIRAGTGAYQNLKGNGRLVMPNDTDEILTGTVR